MSMVKMVEYADASPEARAVFDDIMATRKSDWVNNFWKALATHPPTLRRLWENVKQVMAPGALDPLVKEMLYVAVSVTNNCEYCIHSHTAGGARQGDDRRAVRRAARGRRPGERDQPARRTGYRMPVDPQFVPHRD